MESYELLTKAYKLINLYNTKSRRPHIYADNMILYPAQAHMVEIIGDNEGITLSEIAAQYRITKGAVSQIIGFLDTKGLIVKKPSEKKGRTTALYLSDAGKRLMQEHRALHRNMVEQVNEKLQMIPADALERLSEIVDIIEQNITNI